MSKDHSTLTQPTGSSSHTDVSRTGCVYALIEAVTGREWCEVNRFSV